MMMTVSGVCCVQALVHDIHVVCGCLKDFLRGLKEPLITFKLWNTFARAVGKLCCSFSAQCSITAVEFVHLFVLSSVTTRVSSVITQVVCGQVLINFLPSTNQLVHPSTGSGPRARACF